MIVKGSTRLRKGLGSMRRIFAVLAALAGLGLLPQPATADAANGARLAQQWCTNCHVINGSGASARLPQGPPSFRVAAGHLNTDQLRAFLSHPHGAMPDLALTARKSTI